MLGLWYLAACPWNEWKICVLLLKLCQVFCIYLLFRMKLKLVGNIQLKGYRSTRLSIICSPGENFASLLMVNSSLLRLHILSGDSPFCRGWSRDDIAPFWGRTICTVGVWVGGTTICRVGWGVAYLDGIDFSHFDMNTRTACNFKCGLVVLICTLSCTIMIFQYSYMHTLMWEIGYRK